MTRWSTSSRSTRGPSRARPRLRPGRLLASGSPSAASRWARFDVVPEYVERARSIGVDARVYDGERVPLEDDSVDTVILLEVLEHLEDPAGCCARRVAWRAATCS